MASEPFRLSVGERLILKMLCDLFRHLKISSDIDIDFLEDAISEGHEWALSWEYEKLVSRDTIDHKIVNEVCDILDMWNVIESSFETLGDSEKKTVTEAATAANPLLGEIRFIGFDWNYEGKHASVLRFLTEKLHRYERFRDRDKPTHTEMLPLYRSLLKAYKKSIESKCVAEYLDCDKLVEIFRRGKFEP